jgi:hypothetical protein
MNHKHMQAVSNLFAVLIVFVLSVGSAMAPVKAAPQEVTALEYVGDIGSASSKTTGTTLVITTTAAVAAGNDIVVAFATYGDPNYTISVTDSAGNTYEEAAQAVCYQHGRTYIFAAYNVTALPSGGTITITHTSVGVRAAVASVFSGLEDIDPLDQSLGNPVPADQAQASGTTPTVGPTGTTAQENELLVGAIGTEGPLGDAAGTWDNSFTTGPRTGTTGGDATSNWTVSMGWRIVSATGAYTAQKSGITSRYWAAAIATFKGATPTVNVPPVANDQSVSTPVDTPVAITLTATDDNGDSLIYSVESDPAHGTLSGMGASLTYTPDSGYAGPDSFTFSANDGEFDSNIATVSITVTEPSTLAFAGDIGSASNKTTGTTLVITTTAAVPAGNGIIVAFATYGDPDYAISVTDSAGNTYEEAAQAVCYSHGRTYIFAAYDVTALPSGGTITITHTSVAARAAVASTFTGLAAVDPLDQSLGNPVPGAQEQASGTTPTVGPTGTTAQADELLIGSVGTEGPLGDAAGTWDFSFNAGPRAGTTGGTDTTNWTVSMGWRIVSATGAYTAQKSNITDRYWAAAIATFKGQIVYDLTMAVDPVGGGTTSPAVGSHAYTDGSVVNITATPAAGYAFDHWTGAVADVNSASTTVTMDADKTVTAHFVDIEPPDTTITAHPDDPSSSADASFSFTSTEAGSTFECQLDGGGFSTCTSPQEYTGLADGAHTFEVRAIDAASNVDPTPASFNWTIDTVAPDTTITAHPDDPSSSADASFSFTSTEIGSTFECQLDGGGFSACTSPQEYTGLADGAHTFEVRAIDADDIPDPTPASFSWTIDTVAPDTTITAHPDDPSFSADASFSFTSTEAGSTFECQLDSGGFSVCTSPQEYTGLADGAHTFEVRAIDAASNVDPTPASFGWTIDTGAPDTTITAFPDDPSRSSEASFSFTSTELGSTFECQLDGGGFSTCTSPQEYSGLAYGDHTFEVRAIDGVGNVDPTPASYSWAIRMAVFLPMVMK